MKFLNSGIFKTLKGELLNGKIISNLTKLKNYCRVKYNFNRYGNVK